MPSVQGLDRATAPPAATAKRMLEQIGGRWWNVYIGGPESGGSGWTPELLRDYVRHGIDRFMLTYVGQQKGGTLTPAQGQHDGREAVQIARRFGYAGRVPLCLDVENYTYESAREASVAYTRAWCATVRRLGARPGVYSNPAPLQGMARGGVPADFVWIASWVSRTAGRHDPHDVTGMPDDLWGERGQRAWQYAGEYGGVPCRVLGLDVDINVADLGLLALPPGARAAARRRRRRALARAVARRPVPTVRRAATATAPTPAPAARARTAARGLPGLVRDYARLDAETARAWEAIEAYGAKRRRQAAHADDGDGDLAGVADVLGRIEQQLGRLVDIETRELAIAEHPPAPALPAGEPARAAAAQPDASAAPEQAAPAAPASNGDGSRPHVDAVPRPVRRLADLSDAELDERIERLDHRLDRARAERIARYARVERRLVRNGSRPPGDRTPRPRRAPPADEDPPARSQPGNAERRRHAQRAGRRRPVASDRVRSLQRSLNRFTNKYLKGVVSLEVDGKKGPATDERIELVKFNLGFRASERTPVVTPRFVRRLRNPRSPRWSNPRVLARAARRRQQQRKAAARLGGGPLEGTPRHIVETMVLPIAAQVGIDVSAETIAVWNARHGPTSGGNRSDHQGPGDVAWAADLSNGSSPTPQMDELARRLAQRFDIPWSGSGVVNASHHGYRFQMLYRTADHYNHVHIGVRAL